MTPQPFEAYRGSMATVGALNLDPAQLALRQAEARLSRRTVIQQEFEINEEQLAVQLAQWHFEDTAQALDANVSGNIAHFPFEIIEKAKDDKGVEHKNKELIATTTANHVQLLAHGKYLRQLAELEGTEPTIDVLSLIDQIPPDSTPVVQTVLNLGGMTLEASLQRHDLGKLHAIDYRLRLIAD